MGKTHLCKVSDIPANGMKTYEVSDGRKVLVANAGECYYAYQGMCPHQEVCLDEGLYDGAVLTCHQHLWQWDITTGAPMGLAEAPLERYEVKVDGDDIYVVQPSALQASELFKDASDATLAALHGLARGEQCAGGSTLYSIGDPAEDLYVLESGRVQFLIGRDDRTSAAGFMLRKGEIFGWNALIENQPQRIAQATCLENSKVLRLNGQETLKVLEADPASGYHVMRKLSALIARYLSTSGAT